MSELNVGNVSVAFVAVKVKKNPCSRVFMKYPESLVEWLNSPNKHVNPLATWNDPQKSSADFMDIFTVWTGDEFTDQFPEQIENMLVDLCVRNKFEDGTVLWLTNMDPNLAPE